jgi:hypothetical protein
VWGDRLESAAIDRLAPQLPVNLDGMGVGAAPGADERQLKRTPPSRWEASARSRSYLLDLGRREIAQAKAREVAAVRASTSDSLGYGHADAGYAAVRVLAHSRPP